VVSGDSVRSRRPFGHGASRFGVKNRRAVRVRREVVAVRREHAETGTEPRLAKMHAR
jgi:hypothetical protein